MELYLFIGDTVKMEMKQAILKKIKSIFPQK